MAEAQESLDVSDLKENFLECSVCLEHFDQGEKRPRLLLNCLHSFCTQCLEQLLKKERGGQVTCPNCRQVQKVKGTAQSLPIDPVRNKLVDYVRFKKGRKIPCTDCPDGSDAVARCHECQSYMCTPCKEAHHRNRVTRKHTCQSLEQALNEPVKNFLSHRCEDHPDYKIEFYCEKCSSLCCISCSIVKHKGHDLDPIEDAANYMLSSLKTKIKDLEKSASVMSRKKSSLGEQNKLQEMNMKHTTDLINNKFDGLIGKLNGQRNKLITELKERTEITVNALKKQQEATEDSFAQMESMLEYFKQMESKSDDCEVLTAGPVLVQSLEAAAAMDQTQDGQGPPTWTFSSGAIDKTMSKVHKFGEIKSDTFWNSLISVSVSDTYQTEWRDTFLKAFERTLIKMDPEDCVNILFEEEEVSSMVQDSITNAAFTSFEKLALYDDKYTLKAHMNEKFGRLMSKLLVRHWPKNEDPHEILTFLLSWSPLKRYFERFYGKSSDSERNLLSHDCIDHLVSVASVLDHLKTELCKGSIPIASLRLILKSSQHFLELCSAAATNFSDVDIEKSTEKEILKFTLQAREKELAACENLMQTVKTLLNMAVHIDKVDSNTLYERAREVDKIMMQGIVQDVCEPLFMKQCPESLEDYIPILSLFDVSGELLQIVPQLEAWWQSIIFQALWEKESKTVAAGTDLNTALLNVWKNVRKLWTELCKKVVRGTATFKEVQKHIRMFQRDYGKIKKEFMLMSVGTGNPDWVEGRILQLKCYETLRDCQRSAEIIMEIKDIYEISGDFSSIEAIQILGSSNDKPMKTMNTSVLETCETLEGINETKKQECIRTFKECQPLVIWLRDSMKDGLKELKVFVDLAFISAGEEPMEIHKVNCFHSATTGYAPLIFNTPPETDQAAFLQNCKLVWQEMEADPKLPEKLIDTKRHLRWLQEVKQSHGSVEVTALTQAGMT